MKYNITFACGHDGVINLVGPGKDRERTLEYLKNSGECPECKAERLKRERAEAANEAQEQNLPSLQGSDKQVVWAAEIRRYFCNYCRQMIDGFVQKMSSLPEEKQDKMRSGIQELYEARDHILASRSYARWWIDHRGDRDLNMALYDTTLALREAALTKPGREEESHKRAVEEAVAVVSPDNQNHGGVVKIIVDENNIYARYPRDDDFRSVLSSLHYKWDGEQHAWVRKINQFSGTPGDRVAELGNKLLTAGFAVSIMDEDQRRRAVAAEYAPECRRWVTLYTTGDYAGKLCIRWDREDDLFAQVHKIHGSRWHSGAMSVPVSSWDEVLDMAEMLGFQISVGAREAINTYRSHLASPVSPVSPPMSDQTDNLSKILDSDRGLLPDLIDEDQ